MKIFIVEAVLGAEPWKSWYDKVQAFVVRAENETHAREIASSNHGDEGPAPWLDPACSTCAELTGNGKAGVVLTDYRAG